MKTSNSSKTVQATPTECDKAQRAVELLADLAVKVREARSELVLAGVGTFDMANEHQFLMGLDDRLAKIHEKLASRVRRARSTTDLRMTVFAAVGTGPQECVQISGGDRVGAVIMFRRFGESWQRARITHRVDSRLLLELV